jgi:hypothetical protein
VHCVVSWPRTLERVEIDYPNNAMTPNQSLQPTALWRCASMSILIRLFSVEAQPRSQSGG